MINNEWVGGSESCDMKRGEGWMGLGGGWEEVIFKSAHFFKKKKN
jgi:hypothetical protein